MDSRTDPPPPSVKVTAADIYGTWVGWKGSSLTIRPEHRAVVEKLDGQEFAFDDGWRMSGPGSWRLLKPGAYRGGNAVGDGWVIEVKASPAGLAGEKGPFGQGAGAATELSPDDGASRTEPPPGKAVWDIGVSRSKKGELRLFFLTSDPDIRDTYYLTRKK
ncbi:hypothetical protein [Streptomyces sp. CB01249]|uniref:hypothetical protein n=1 Tax=Streptomyces sp. CB01249 TaxID=1703929 RepID=UPI001161289E|nr:hypothetical protein [Streptomyces sp. CB01249]